MYAYLNMTEPEKPEYSFLIDWLVYAYFQINRSRRYEQGVPLPLSIQDISCFAECDPPPVGRQLFNRVVFAIDDVALEASRK